MKTILKSILINELLIIITINVKLYDRFHCFSLALSVLVIVIKKHVQDSITQSLTPQALMKITKSC